jgi:hypothetical protein
MTRSIALLLAVSVTTLTSRATATVDSVPVRAEVPVTDLTAADITVKEGGKDRPVATLQPASGPMQIAIIVDDAGIGSFQPALGQFFQKTVGRAQFSITQLNPQATRLVDFTDDVDALKGALGRLGRRGRSEPDGDQMLDAILQAAKALRQRKAERPVILALTITGGLSQAIEPTDVLTALRLSGASLNVVFIIGAELGMVMGDGPKQSGGRLEQAGTGPAIGTAALRIADALQHQYLLTYLLPDGVKMSDRITVATSRKGVELTAPSRIADK